MNTDYAVTLTSLYPEAEWTLNGNDYATLEWHSETPKPTQAELDQAWQQVQQELSDKETAAAAARDAAIAHAKSLGFTDDMIAVMYPGLTV